MWLVATENIYTDDFFELFESKFIPILRYFVFKLSKLKDDDIDTIIYPTPHEYLLNKGEIDIEFKNLIAEITNAIKIKTKHYRKHELNEFLDNQSSNFEKFYPSKRNSILFEEFIIEMNSDFIFDSTRDLDFYNVGFEFYVKYYNILISEIQEHFEFKSDVSNKGKTETFYTIDNKNIAELKSCLVNEIEINEIEEKITLFLNKKSPINDSPYQVKHRRIKYICRIMGNIYKDAKNDTLTFEYLEIYPKLFSCISHSDIDYSKSITNNKLYKYSMIT